MNLLGMALMALVLFSCKGDGKGGGKSLFTPVSSGRPYEMLVVMDKDMWERPAGRALFNVLDQDVSGLPQPERSFRISQIIPDKFKRGFRIFRNIIDVDIQPIYTQGKLVCFLFILLADADAAAALVGIRVPGSKENLTDNSSGTKRGKHFHFSSPFALNHDQTRKVSAAASMTIDTMAGMYMMFSFKHTLLQESAAGPAAEEYGKIISGILCHADQVVTVPVDVVHGFLQLFIFAADLKVIHKPACKKIRANHHSFTFLLVLLHRHLQAFL